MKTALLLVSVALLLAACSPPTVTVNATQNLSALSIFQTTVSEPVGSKLTVYVESGGISTAVLDFVVGSERPTLFIQTDLPNNMMQVAIATTTHSEKVLLNSPFSSPGGGFQAYGRERWGNKVILGKADSTLPQLIYVAPTPKK